MNVNIINYVKNIFPIFNDDGSASDDNN
jgi:hypothetical protein